MGRITYVYKLDFNKTEWDKDQIRGKAFDYLRRRTESFDDYKHSNSRYARR